jgi:hypothetical protein
MASPHNPMLNEKGELWMTQPVRPPGAENNPKWSARTVALDTKDPAARDTAAQILASRNHGMQLGYFDIKTHKFVGVDTSYNTHHLQFDWQGRIWTDGDVLGMLDTTKLNRKDIEGTEAEAQKGLDANGHEDREGHSDHRLRDRREPGRRHRVGAGSNG